MTADAETMREMLAWLHAEHGGFEPYMLGHGLHRRRARRCSASVADRAGS